MGLNLLSIGNLVLAAPYCIFYAKGIKLIKVLTQMTWFSLGILVHNTKTDKNTEDTQGPILLPTHKHILWQTAIWAQHLAIPQWMNNFLIQKFSLQRSTISFLFKDYSLLEVMHVLIKCSKTKSFLWNTKNTSSNGINGLNTYNTQRERKL